MAYRTLRVNDSGDLDLAGGRAHMIENDEATAQLIRSFLRTFLGEWFLAKLTLGVSYWDDVLVKAPNGGVLEAIFSAAILGRPGVRSLESLDLELVDDPERALVVEYVANTKTGPIARSVPLELL